MNALKTAILLLALLALTTQAVRHIYVRYIEPRTSVLDRFDETAAKKAIQSAASPRSSTISIPTAHGIRTFRPSTSSSVTKTNDPEEILKMAAKMEQEAVGIYNQFALEAGANADSATKQMFEALVNDEETHFDEFDKQLDNIKRFGA